MIVILHNIRSLYNVGSVFRTADALKIEKIYLTGITPSPLDRFGKLREQFSKVALGGERTVPWECVKNPAKVLGKTSAEGCELWAVEQAKNSVPYLKAEPGKKRIALLLGNEVRGLPPSILKKAGKIIEIPMGGKKESLNVAVAFAVVGYHFKYVENM